MTRGVGLTFPFVQTAKNWLSCFLELVPTICACALLPASIIGMLPPRSAVELFSEEIPRAAAISTLTELIAELLLRKTPSTNLYFYFYNSKRKGTHIERIFEVNIIPKLPGLCFVFPERALLWVFISSATSPADRFSALPLL